MTFNKPLTNFLRIILEREKKENLPWAVGMIYWFLTCDDHGSELDTTSRGDPLQKSEAESVSSVISETPELRSEVKGQEAVKESFSLRKT